MMGRRFGRIFSTPVILAGLAPSARAGYTDTTHDDPVAGAFGTTAQGINGSGTVAGSYQDSSGGTHGFVYGGGSYITLDDPSSAGSIFAQSINDSGAVVGYYADSSGGIHGFVAVEAVPEPSSLTLAGALALLAGLRPRRRVAPPLRPKARRVPRAVGLSSLLNQGLTI